MLRFACPTCLAVLKAPDGTGGQKTRCPNCQQAVEVPRISPQTLPGQPVQSPAFFAPAAPPPQIIIQQASDASDPAGVISLILGIFVFCSLPLACCTYGLSLIGTVVLAAAGALFGFVARGNLRAAGLLLNLIVLIPAVLAGFIMLVLLAIGAALPSPPPSSVPQSRLDWHIDD